MFKKKIDIDAWFDPDVAAKLRDALGPKDAEQFVRELTETARRRYLEKRDADVEPLPEEEKRRVDEEAKAAGADPPPFIEYRAMNMKARALGIEPLSGEEKRDLAEQARAAGVEVRDNWLATMTIRAFEKVMRQVADEEVSEAGLPKELAPGLARGLIENVKDV